MNLKNDVDKKDQIKKIPQCKQIQVNIFNVHFFNDINSN